MAAVAAALQALSRAHRHRASLSVPFPSRHFDCSPKIDLSEEQKAHGLVLGDGVKAGAEVGDKGLVWLPRNLARTLFEKRISYT